jgi:hypothetical protein
MKINEVMNNSKNFLMKNWAFVQNYVTFFIWIESTKEFLMIYVAFDFDLKITNEFMSRKKLKIGWIFGKNVLNQDRVYFDFDNLKGCADSQIETLKGVWLTSENLLTITWYYLLSKW